MIGHCTKSMHSGSTEIRARAKKQMNQEDGGNACCGGFCNCFALNLTIFLIQFITLYYVQMSG